MEDTENLRRRFLVAEEVTYCYKLSILGSFVMLGYCWDNIFAWSPDQSIITATRQKKTL